MTGPASDPAASRLDSGPTLPVVLFVACLLPFLGKPFHLDDPMFIWAARQVAASPLDFYGFVVNWHGTATPMTTVMKNPPLVSYYLAAAAQVVGWSEVALHAAMLLPAAGLAAGAFQLARLYTLRPGDATLAAMLTPVVLVSSTTIMSDVPMLCAWVWAMVLWTRGLREDRAAALASGALLAAGFYTDVWGPLPFAAGPVPDERYRVYRSLVPIMER